MQLDTASRSEVPFQCLLLPMALHLIVQVFIWHLQVLNSLVFVYEVDNQGPMFFIVKQQLYNYTQVTLYYIIP